jgi:hypothetical protein
LSRHTNLGTSILQLLRSGGHVPAELCGVCLCSLQRLLCLKTFRSQHLQCAFLRGHVSTARLQLLLSFLQLQAEGSSL